MRDFFRLQGIRPQRIAAAGYGESYPIAPDTTPEGRQANRRVELTLLPLTRS